MFTTSNTTVTAGGRRFTRAPLRSSPVAPVWQPDPLTTPVPANAWRALQLGRCAEKVRIQEDLRGRHHPPTPRQIMQRAISMHLYGQIQPCEVRVKTIADVKNVPVLNSGFTLFHLLEHVVQFVESNRARRVRGNCNLVSGNFLHYVALM